MNAQTAAKSVQTKFSNHKWLESGYVAVRLTSTTRGKLEPFSLLFAPVKSDDSRASWSDKRRVGMKKILAEHKRDALAKIAEDKSLAGKTNLNK